MIVMKIRILCKDENEENIKDNSFVIRCSLCRGIDTLTSIKVILKDYQDEIDEIVYPHCDLLKNMLKKVLP